MSNVTKTTRISDGDGCFISLKPLRDDGGVYLLVADGNTDALFDIQNAEAANDLISAIRELLENIQWREKA